MGSPLLVIENVTKIFRYGVFGFRFKAVDGVNIVLEDRPMIFTIAGESGSGKTTLARMILRILRPDSGTIYFKGYDIYELDSLTFYRNIQPVLQDPYASFNPMKKVIRYLEETSRNLLGMKDEAKIKEYVNSILDYVGLDLSRVADKYPHEFSGGELQRVSIARALIPQPRLIVADEPVSMLDASLRMNIVNLFKKIKEEKGISFIYITHDLATAYYMSDYIAIMFRGTIVELGASKKVLSKPLHPYTQELLESLPTVDPKRRIEWIQKRVRLSHYIEEEEFVSKGCKFAPRCPFAMEKCRTTDPPEIDVGGVRVKCWLYTDEHSK